MTFTISRQQLTAELTLLSAALKKKETLPILSYVKLEFQGTRLTQTATNLNVTLTSELGLLAGSNPESYCLPLRQLSQLIKLFDGDEVHLTTRANSRIEVKCGSSRHLLPSQPEAEFPDVDRATLTEAITINSERLTLMLEHISFAVLVPQGDLRQSEQRFTGIAVTLSDNELTVAATNKLRLAIARTKVTGPEFSVIIEAQAADILRGFEGEVQLGLMDNFFIAKCGPRQLITRIFMDKPFDWKAMFPIDYAHQVELQSEPLAKALRRALVTGRESARFVIDGLKWTLSGDTLAIESKGGDSGKSDERLAITCPSLNGSSLAFGVNGASLLEYLSLTEKTLCQFSEGKSVIRFTPVTAKEFEYEFLANTVNLRW